MGVASGLSVLGGYFCTAATTLESAPCPLSGAERRSLLGGQFYIKCMLKSIGDFVFVRSKEVVRFWEGPLREAPLYICTSIAKSLDLVYCTC